jgi:hypothetical protein
MLQMIGVHIYRNGYHLQHIAGSGVYVPVVLPPRTNAAQTHASPPPFVRGVRTPEYVKVCVVGVVCMTLDTTTVWYIYTCNGQDTRHLIRIQISC